MSPSKDGSLDGGSEWCYSQFHLQLERAPNSSREIQMRGGGLQQTQR
jgi:hypothetical protein